MKYLTFFSLIVLSLTADDRYIEVNYETSNDNPFPYFTTQIGSKKSLITSFIFSLYYPCIVYYQNKADYDESQSTTYKKVSEEDVSLVDSVEYPDEKTTYQVGQDTLFLTEGGEKEIPLEKINFLFGEKNNTEGYPSGFIGLAPKINPKTTEGLVNEKDKKDIYSVGTLDLLYKNGAIKNKMVSFGPLKEKTDGAFEGTVYLGGKHIDFMTSKEGKTVNIPNINEYQWGAKMTKLTFNNQDIVLKENIIFTNHEFSAVFPSKYLDEFKKILPKDGNCNESENGDSITCNSWSVGNIRMFLNYEKTSDEDEKSTYKFSVKVDDLNDLRGIARKHYIFNPNIRFSDDVKDIYIPMIWFRDYHVLFVKGNDDKNLIYFHSYDKDTIYVSGDENEEVDDTNYLKVSKATFVILCIAFGIVIVCLILLLGYYKIKYKKTGKGASRAALIKEQSNGVEPLFKRQTTFDSSLLGKSSDSMPTRHRSVKVKH